MGYTDCTHVVCIVDDDDAVRDSMRALVEAYGHCVRDYESASAYLDDLPSPEPACLLVDLNMPGMSGLELVEYLRRRHVHTPTIIVTAHKEAVVPERAERAGVLALLGKPVRDDELIGWIDNALQTSSAPH